MKTWIRALGIGLVFFTLLVCSPRGPAAQASQAAASAPAQIMWEPAEDQWDHTSRFQVLAIIEKLQNEIDGINALSSSESLPDDAVKRLSKLHGKHGILVGPDGKIHGGPDNILKHLNDNKSKIKKFNIQLKFVYAKEFTERFKDPNGSKDDVVHSLIFIFSSSYEYDGKPVDPPSTAACPHLKLCDCSK